MIYEEKKGGKSNVYDKSPSQEVPSWLRKSKKMWRPNFYGKGFTKREGSQVDLRRLKKWHMHFLYEYRRIELPMCPGMG